MDRKLSIIYRNWQGDPNADLAIALILELSRNQKKVPTSFSEIRDFCNWDKKTIGIFISALEELGLGNNDQLAMEFGEFILTMDDIESFARTKRRKNPREEGHLRELELDFLASEGDPGTYQRLNAARARSGLGPYQPKEVLAAYINGRIDEEIKDLKAFGDIPTFQDLVNAGNELYKLRQESPGPIENFDHFLYFRLNQLLKLSSEEVERIIGNAVATAGLHLANEWLAQSGSIIDDQDELDNEGYSLWKEATFGYAFGINGNLALDGSGNQASHAWIPPPEGYGVVYWNRDIDEQVEILGEHIIERAAFYLSIPKELTRAMSLIRPESYYYRDSSRGDITLYRKKIED